VRILFAVHGLPPERRAGVELYADSLARELARRGHSVAMVVRGLGAGGEDLRVERRSGVEVFVIDVPRRKRRFLDLYSDGRIDAAFGRALLGFRPDVFHAQHLQGLSVGMLDVARASGAALVLSLHDFWLGCPRGQRVRDDRSYCADIDRGRCARCLRPEWQGIHRDPYFPLRLARNVFANPSARILAEYDRLVRAALLGASMVLTPSDWYRDEYVLWYGLDPARVRAVAPGMPHAVSRRPRPERRRGEPFTVGYVGSLIPTKGVHVLAEAVAGIDRPGFRLAIHGGSLGFFGRAGAEYENEIREISKRSRSEIVLHGPYAPESLEPILASFDALALPSIYPESYSLTLREGWMAGVPVVASRLGALEGAVRDGENGLLAEPGNVAAWRAAILRLEGDSALRDRLSAAAPAIATMAVHADEMESIYSKLEPAPGALG
jgi:glycosyltransferase involved in cell wall biosynthesis